MTTPDYGRAGRNLPAATVVGLGLLGLVILSLLTEPVLFGFIVAFAMVLAVREMNLVLVVGLSNRLALVLQLCAPVIVLVAEFTNATGLLISYVASVLLVLIVRLFDGQEAYVHHVSRSIFILTYAPLLASFAVLLSTQENGAWKVMAFVLLTAATDFGGYVVGARFGKHPMAPKISPKKSWEGFAGALVLQVLVGALLWQYVFSENPLEGVLVGLIMFGTATFGDLIESMIKRDLGIKDMGNLLPGHGGVMDRIDSLLVNAFVAWILFGIFL